MQKSSKVNILPLWEPSAKTIADTEAGSKCEWHMASVEIPRQVSHLTVFTFSFLRSCHSVYALVWSWWLGIRSPCLQSTISRLILLVLTSVRVDANPTSGNYLGSHTGINFNQTFATCGKTGTDIPTYDDCRRESLSTGGSEVEVNADGSRNLTISKDGFYW